MKKPDSVVRISASPDTNFFMLWFEFLKPLHKLTTREIEVVAEFIKYRYALSKKVTDEAFLDHLSMNDDAKKTVRENLGLSSSHLQVILGRLKKSKVIVDNRIDPRFIPTINVDSEGFQLLLYFDFTHKPEIKKL